MRNRLAGIVATLLLWWPQAAYACAVCFSARSDDTRHAFALTTVFLTLLPLLAIGGAAWWLVRRARQMESCGPGPGEARATPLRSPSARCARPPGAC
jgi:hypothetical protein